MAAAEEEGLLAEEEGEAVALQPDADEDDFGAEPEEEEEAKSGAKEDKGGDKSGDLRSALKKKGRGFDPGNKSGSRIKSKEDEGNGKTVPQKSVEGWAIIVTGVHEEASDEDLKDFFLEYGQIQNLALNLDRHTGFVKGYAFIEYEKYEEALAAVTEGTGQELLGLPIAVDWAIVKPPKK